MAIFAADHDRRPFLADGVELRLLYVRRNVPCGQSAASAGGTVGLTRVKKAPIVDGDLTRVELQVDCATLIDLITWDLLIDAEEVALSA